ncbi:MAG: FAD-dependent oxidoreductase [Pseudomonadota bacterium]|nr:FAD-dependent oxidoreductase [Pseudomonadota bacterium]
MSPRIGIVGAGPGGLSLARLLSDQGHADVTLLERSERVGGKSLTVTHEGLGHELGTCYLGTGYTTVRKWMEQASIREHALPRQVIELEHGERTTFEDYVLGGAGRIGAAAQIARYVRDWILFHDWELRGAPDDAIGTNGRLMREEVADSFLDWLRARDLDVVARFALRSMTVMGYGATDRVPALYGLRWNMPSLLWAAVTTQIAEPAPGWSALWTHLAYDLDVRLGTTITSVERRQGGFEVHTDRGPFSFDHLVLTTPLDEAAAWFPFDAVDRAALPVDGETLRWGEMVSTLIDAGGWFRDSDTRCWEARAKDGPSVARGQVLGARRTGDKTGVAKARSRTRPDVYVTYQYGSPDRSDADLLATLHADLAAEGATVNTVLRQCRWRYSPQYTPEAIRGGAVARFERHQGRGNLWISGATASHEAVDNIVDANERLVERMALAFAGGDPSDDAAFENIAQRFRWRLDDK